MKKTLLAIALCITPGLVLAAQAPVTQIDKFNSAATKIDDVRVATNVRLAAAQSNFTELYTLLGGNPWLAQTTAPSIHNVFWIDTTGEPPTIKYWDGDSWEVAAASGDGTYTLPTASAEAKGGVKIGARLTMTGEVLSADVQTTDISGKEDSLGNPSVNGYVLSSTTTGVRSWVEMTGGGTMTYPGAGIPVSTGTAWGSSITLGTGVSSALGYAPDASGGFLLANTYLADPKIAWDTATITEVENSPVAGTNAISVKSGVFQAADPQLDTWAGVIPGTGMAAAIAVNADTVGGLPVTIAKGAYTVDTASIAANTCASAVAVTATGVVTTDTIIASPNAIISSVSGFGVTTAGAVRVDVYPTSGNVNFQFCNPTGAAIDPGSVTFNWRVLR